MIREDRDNQQTAFLLAFTRCGLVGEAAKEAGTTVTSIRNWRESDPDFAAAYDDAVVEADDMIRSEIHHRAFGYPRQLVHNGRLTGETIEEFDYRALLLLARSRLPEMKTQHFGLELTGEVTIDTVRNQFLDRLMQMAERMSATETEAVDS